MQGWIWAVWNPLLQEPNASRGFTAFEIARVSYLFHLWSKNLFSLITLPSTPAHRCATANMEENSRNWSSCFFKGKKGKLITFIEYLVHPQILHHGRQRKLEKCENTIWQVVKHCLFNKVHEAVKVSVVKIIMISLITAPVTVSSEPKVI